MKIKTYFLLIALMVAFNPVFSQKPLVLADGVKSNYRIVICGDTKGYEARAASILQTSIKKMTGAELPVVINDALEQEYEIRIGSSGNYIKGLEDYLPKLKEDGFWIKTYGNKLLIYGGTRKGVIYGVTALLEDAFGYRKLAPDVEYVPKYSTLVLNPIDKLEVPPASIRIVNGPIPYSEDYRDWRKLATIGDFWNDGSWNGYYVHTFNRLVPRENYFDTHPEYFSLVNGKRIAYGQLCLSNPEVLKITIAKLKEEMAARPEVLYWSVSQNDTYDNCQCDKCRAIDQEEGSPSGTMIRFVNEVAKAFPDKVITTLAYQYTRKPPLITRPEKNVMITLCTIELNRSRPIETDPGSASFVEDIIGWSKITNNIMLWDYEVQFTNFLCPFPLFNTLQPNLQFFTKYNVNAHFQQCNAQHGTEFAEMKSYYLSKLLWNPQVNGDSVLNDFMKHYYMEAAPYIREYFDLLHSECQRSGCTLDIYGSPVHYRNTFLTAPLLKKYNEIFDRAEQAVAHRPEVLERVRIDRLPIQYAAMEIGKTDLFGERGWYEEKDGDFLVRPEMKKMLEDFYACCKRNGIVSFNENGLTADIYYQTTLRFIDVQVKDNLAFRKNIICEPAPDKRYECDGPSTLTNGVKGTDDYKINWLGWEGQDVEISLDLGKAQSFSIVCLSTLQYIKSWILHPASVTMSYSEDGDKWTTSMEQTTDPEFKVARDIKVFTWAYQKFIKARYFKFRIKATKVLPQWHNYAGNKSWLFIDEIVVK